jgi:hypothetical protein
MIDMLSRRPYISGAGLETIVCRRCNSHGYVTAAGHAAPVRRCGWREHPVYPLGAGSVDAFLLPRPCSPDIARNGWWQ